MKAQANRRHVPRTSIRANQSRNRGERNLRRIQWIVIRPTVIQSKDILKIKVVLCIMQIDNRFPQIFLFIIY